MQFRERRRVIQVIRTTYDPELKRGRSEMLGKLDKSAPAVTDALRAACTAEELAEVATYLDGRQENHRSASVRAGAETLPDQMRKAAEYFHAHQDDKALAFATEIRGAWEELKKAMRKAGFSKGKVRHAAKAVKSEEVKPAKPLVAKAAVKPAVVKAPKPKAPAKKAVAPETAES
ncbi:hypothetical protein [Azospirillum sp. sgz301742]